LRPFSHRTFFVRQPGLQVRETAAYFAADAGVVAARRAGLETLLIDARSNFLRKFEQGFLDEYGPAQVGLGPPFTRNDSTVCDLANNTCGSHYTHVGFMVPRPDIYSDCGRC